MREGAIELQDGRRLAYADRGPTDAPVIFYFHGSPGSRRELWLSEPVFERRRPVARVIAPDRPGYGGSSPRVGFRYLDWPFDLTQLADQLGIERFAVLGASGGSPYAFACGSSLADRVTRIGIVVGGAPIEAPGMRQAPAITAFPANGVLRRAQFAAVAAGIRLGLTGLFARRMHSEMGSADRRAMERPEVRAWFEREPREAYAGWGAAGAREAGLARRPWGFDLSAVRTETHLWYGGEDRTIPVTAGNWMAERLADATFRVWPRHGHFSWAIADEAVDVIETLTA